MKARPPLIDIVVGTRPNMVKAGPLLACLRDADWCRPRLAFLAQHTLDAMTTQTLEDVRIKTDEVHRIDIESSGVGQRLGEMMEKYMAHLQSSPPALVLVLGDVDSTLAAAYAAKRLHIPVAHVEAGLRSGDLAMPEELNRRMVDSISDLLFTTTERANEHLLSEGRQKADIHFTGNLMIDSLQNILAGETFVGSVQRLRKLHGIDGLEYAIATFHRPSNVDSMFHLERTVRLLEEAAKRLPVIFPVHPRSEAALRRHGLRVGGDVKLIPPLRYSDFIALLVDARVALTDSGGLQEETSILGVPCLTFRANTERPETVAMGTNRLARPEEAGVEVDRVIASPRPVSTGIPLWDGHAAPRIANVLRKWVRDGNCAGRTGPT